MVVAVAFDTLTYARRLREVGVPQEQAEAHAEALAAAVTETLVTKQDLWELAAATRGEFQQLRQELQQLATTMKSDLQQLATAAKGDVQQLAATTNSDMRQLAATMKGELREFAATTKQDMRELELRLSVRLGGMLGMSVAAVAALVKLL